MVPRAQAIEWKRKSLIDLHQLLQALQQTRTALAGMLQTAQQTLRAMNKDAERIARAYDDSIEESSPHYYRDADALGEIGGFPDSVVEVAGDARSQVAEALEALADEVKRTLAVVGKVKP
jgi:ABC-type transporter Mla subunit MlaD